MRGYEGKLYLLALDHRSSFERMFGFSGCPTEREKRSLCDAKSVIFEGFRQAVREGVPKETAGILVDAQYGATVARSARVLGYRFAMPVEKSGQKEFDFEYGESFGEQIEEFDPTFTKALVRLNPESNAAAIERQLARLRRLSEWLRERERKFLFELLVPAEPHQLERLNGDVDRYDDELRPQLMLRAIDVLHGAGVEPDVWKIEGIGSREACREISDRVRSHGREGVACVVLGRGASVEKLDRWLRAAAGLPGYIGFAIGRSIFGDAVKTLTEGGRVDLAACTASIARNYRRFTEVYEGASRPRTDGARENERVVDTSCRRPAQDAATPAAAPPSDSNSDRTTSSTEKPRGKARARRASSRAVCKALDGGAHYAEGGKVLVYIEYISRRPGVSLEAFHEVAGRGQTGWAGEYGDDQLVLNVGRTWRAGPEPEYFAAWYNASAGLERIGEWERIFTSGEAAAFEEPFKLAARIDRSGCYEPLLEPVAGAGGPYYAEYIAFAARASRDDVAAFYRERRDKHSELELNLLVDRIGALGPEPRALAVWTLPAYAALKDIAGDLDDVTEPVRLVTAGLYADLGHEIL